MFRSRGFKVLCYFVWERHICYNKGCVISSDKARSTKMAPEAQISEQCFAESIQTGIQDWNVMHYGYITEKELKSCLPRSKQLVKRLTQTTKARTGWNWLQERIEWEESELWSVIAAPKNNIEVSGKNYHSI